MSSKKWVRKAIRRNYCFSDFFKLETTDSLGFCSCGGLSVEVIVQRGNQVRKLFVCPKCKKVMRPY